MNPLVTVDVDHTPYLPLGQRTVDATVRVTVTAPSSTLTLRLWTPVGARLAFVQQVAPTEEDLTDRRVDVGHQCADYALGTWGDEEHRYRLRVDIDPSGGREKLAARVRVLAGEDVLGEGLVAVRWTADEHTGTARLRRET